TSGRTGSEMSGAFFGEVASKLAIREKDIVQKFRDLTTEDAEDEEARILRSAGTHGFLRRPRWAIRSYRYAPRQELRRRLSLSRRLRVELLHRAQCLPSRRVPCLPQTEASRARRFVVHGVHPAIPEKQRQSRQEEQEWLR